MLNHFLFDLLRWTWELNPRSALAGQGRGTPETDNSMRGHKEAQKARNISNFDFELRISKSAFRNSKYLVPLCGCALCLFVVCLTLFPDAPYSGRSGGGR